MKKQNILIIMPRLVKNPQEGYQFPLGIAYISTCMKQAELNVFTLNLNHDLRSIEMILEEKIKQNNIDIVMTGGISIQYNSLHQIVCIARAIKPEVKIIIGGGIISADPETAMKALEHVDIGVIGEGEITAVELINAIQDNKDLKQVNGLIFKKGEKYIITPPREEIKDLDSIPYPDYVGFELDKYLELPPPDVNNLNERRMAFILGSRGCPFQCTFCFHTVGKKYRQRSIKSITDEIDWLVENYKIEFLFMADELFGSQKSRFREFCEYMKDKNLGWRGSFRVDNIDEETIKLLKIGNCSIIGLGLESADDGILKSMKKHITLEKIENALKLVFDSKIPFSGNFIFGDINETVETAQKTLDWWESHPEYSLNLWPIVTYPGTHLYKYACENGIIKDKVKFLKDCCPAVNVSKMNASEMSWLAKTLLESPYKKAKNIEDVKVKYINPESGRVNIEGKCAQCGHKNTWEHIRLFISVSLTCQKCAQKHNTPFPEELQQRLAKQVEQLLKEYDKIAMWGVTLHTIGLYDKFEIYKSKRIFAIDNVSSKQMIDLYGKKVHAPDILAEESIQLVISFFPNSTQQLTMQINEMYPSVKKVIDASQLLTQETIQKI